MRMSLQQLARMELPEVYAQALAQTSWPGRAQVVHDSPFSERGVESAENLVFCLDGAHTGESAAACAEWFADNAAPPSVRVLMFNCMPVRRIGTRFRWRLMH